jgi:acetyl-CoA acetyltransferase
MTADVVIAGVGMTRFTKQAERGHEGLAAEAVDAALRDAGVEAREIQASFCGSVAGGGAIGQRVLKRLGVTGAPIVNVENACASSSTALFEALAWIRGGLADVCLAMGVEILSPARGPLKASSPGSGSWVFETGLNLPAWYGLKASRHMATHGLRREELAAVVVKNRAAAAHNPFAHFQSPVTADEVLASPMVADPLTLYQCCPKVDGASAAIVCSADFARSRGIDAGAVGIRGFSLVSGTAVFTDSPPASDAAHRAAAQAYERAGLGPDDLDVVECHDAFSIGEILYTEALGLCAEGEGGRLAASGATALGGSGPTVNPSGGLLSRGHPLGASGIGQITELVWQLRGQAAGRQVEGARIAAAHTMGASEFELDANVCAVFILER